MKTIDDIKNVLIVGAGTLGMRIALRCAFDGYKVKMFDISDDQLTTAVDMQSHIAGGLLRRGVISQEHVDNARANLTTTSDIDEAVSNIDLVSESVIENIDIKRSFYQDFVPRLEKGVILTTNTSFLMPSDLADCMVEPELFCGFHFHDVFNQVVVDIMPHSGTDQAVVDLLMEFGKKINQIPVFIQKENPGYIFNSILGVILSQAGTLAVDGIGSIQDIDRSFMGNFKTLAGPFGMLDQIGLDTAHHIASVGTDENNQKFAALLKSYIDQGKLGFKTGEGFYTYPKPEYSQPRFLKP